MGPSARAAGFYVPDEAARHERTFMQLPTSLDSYERRNWLRDVQDTIIDIANTVSDFEEVVLLCAAEHHAYLRPDLSDNVVLWDVPTDDLWARDSGPLFVTDGKGGLAVSHLNFNAWGGRSALPDDERLARRVAERMDLHVFDNGLVGEGGGVEQDGDGTLIAHASSWVNPNRNRGSVDEVAERLCDAFGAQKVIWAPGLIGQDITDAHIDAFARFVEPGHVLIQLPEDDVEPSIWSDMVFETYDILSNVTDARGRRLRITEIPDPMDPRVTSDDFVSSYANYYVCNGGIICAQFGDPEADEIARRSLEQLYPGRTVVQLNVDALGEFGGGIHCATQQQPAV